ncbi:hypothetical protein [Streptomyces sp. NPDC051684]|uniref:hypothetical protein n=1 Tax=Streptomyces sp. NPDC051684 TaxID=3365670 RepID=UPI0037AF634D
MERHEIETFPHPGAGELHIRRTAELLHLSSGRGGQTIAKLERRVGGALFTLSPTGDHKGEGAMIRQWYTALGINVLLGIPAIVPISMLYFTAVLWVHPAGAEFGGDPSAALVLFGPMAAACAVLWWLANRPLARRTRLGHLWYWLLALAGALLPTATVISIWP